MIRLIAILLLLRPICSSAQMQQGQALIDSLLAELPWMKEDTTGVKLLNAISSGYFNINPDEGIRYGQQALILAQKLGWKKGAAYAYLNTGSNYRFKAAQDQTLDYYIKALGIMNELKDKEGTGRVTYNLGLYYYNERNYPKALQYFSPALKLAEESGDKKTIMKALSSIGSCLSIQDKDNEALDNYQQSLKIAEELGNENGHIAMVMDNIGKILFFKQKKYAAALSYMHKAVRIGSEIGDKRVVATTLGGIGLSYLRIANDTGYISPDSLIPAGREANLAKAIQYYQKAISLNKEIGNRSGLIYQYRNLSYAYEAVGNYPAALESFQQHILYRDSIDNKERTKVLTQKELAYEFGKREDSMKYQQSLTNERLKQRTLLSVQQKQQLEISSQQLNLANKEKDLQRLAYLKTQADLQTEQIRRKGNQKALTLAEKEKALQGTRLALQQSQLGLKDKELTAKRQERNVYVAGVVVLLLFSFFIFRNFRIQKRSNRIISAEKQRSEDLLLNILPAEVAEELKQKGNASAKLYEQVSVLFTDFVDFTGIAERLSPQELVRELNECFTAFDAIIDRNGLEKIKTIGDAYMAVCGLPVPDASHAGKAVRAAIEIRDFIAARRKGRGVFEIRIGINSGPVVAGIVGVKKFAYDIWGDAVNMAARMEQHGAPGNINISQRTYELVKDNFRCDYRGKISAKHKGEIAMYFVKETVAEPIEAGTL